MNHNGMYLKLIQRGLPLCIINLIVYWYSNLTSCVKWNHVYSKSFSVGSGVRQGGVLSPHLFAIYKDDLVAEMRRLKIGCHIVELFVACLLYADDICLLAPCRSALQTLLDTSERYGKFWCLSYNPLKSKVVAFGSKLSYPKFYMYGEELDMVDKYKYLGITVVAGPTFSTSNVRSLIRFRSSANTILNATRASSEPVLLKLLYSICVPHLTYASDVIAYSARQMQPMTVALNDCIRRIFGYNRWESVRHLRLSFGYQSVTDIFSSRSHKFLLKLPVIGNPSLKRLSEIDIC